MKWWKQVALSLTVTILGVGSFLAYRAIAKQHDLRETLLWIDQTYNPHEGGDNLGQGHGQAAYYLQKPGEEKEIFEKSEMTVTQDGSCDVVIREQNPAVGAHNDVSSDTTFTLSLRDVDPESIKTKIYGRSAEIEFLTRNSAPVVKEEMVSTFLKLTGSDHESKHVSKANHVFLIVDDVPYAQRLAKALKHAVELCGGKASRF